ncbi:MAG: hypothetical protein AAF416_14335 [Pseudomonadota bacterium]
MGLTGTAATVVTGAITAAGYGAAAGLALGGVKGAVTGEGFVKGALDGASTGFVTGAITGGIGAGLGYNVDPFKGIGVEGAASEGAAATGLAEAQSGADALAGSAGSDTLATTAPKGAFGSSTTSAAVNGPSNVTGFGTGDVAGVNFGSSQGLAPINPTQTSALSPGQALTYGPADQISTGAGLAPQSGGKSFLSGLTDEGGLLGRGGFVDRNPNLVSGVVRGVGQGLLAGDPAEDALAVIDRYGENYSGVDYSRRTPSTIAPGQFRSSADRAASARRRYSYNPETRAVDRNY